MTAYPVARRNGLKPRSESYLANYLGALDDLDMFAVTRAANAVETALGISAAQLWKKRLRRGLPELKHGECALGSYSITRRLREALWHRSPGGNRASSASV